MKNIISILMGAFIFYVSYHGSVGVTHDLITLFISNQAQQEIFVQSDVFNKIIPFISFLIPGAITALILSLWSRDWTSLFGATVCFCYGLFLLMIIHYHFSILNNLLVSDILAPLAVFPLSWLIFSKYRLST